VQYFLEDKEFSIFLVTRADQIVEVLKKARPTLLVVDCVTPQMNGFAVFRWLRLEGGLREIPCLLITVGRSHHRIREDENTAAVDFLDVPMRQSDFIGKLKTLYVQARSGTHVRNLAPPPPPAGSPIESGQVILNAGAVGRSVMIVEDDPDHSRLVRQILEKEGYKVVESNNLEAFKTAILNKPDIIVLDLMMPVLDGFVLAEVLKACRLTRHIPIIFLTALHETQYLEAAKQFNAAAYLTKPVAISNFLFTINMVLTSGQPTKSA
jgi:DNA-binding response OmpR family regulator